MENECDSVDSTRGGNTNSPRRARKWVFTYNNPPESAKADLVSWLDEKSQNKYVFQLERGESGTPHFQGCIWFQHQRTFSALQRKLPGVHWEVCRDWGSAVSYCSKEDTREDGPWFRNVVLTKACKTIKTRQLYQWQKEVMDIIANEPDDRTIHWYWDAGGRTGKTQFCKYLAVHHDAIILGGRAQDMFYAICQLVQKGTPPRIIVFDIPRARRNYVSYEGLEKVKDGIFFSPKYESGQVIFDSPHIFVFANFEPERDLLSEDRWQVIDIII